MTTKQQEILQIEQDAKELVNNLKALHEKVGSFQVAKETLEKTNFNLHDFIERTQNLTEESHKIIEHVNKIGSSKIFEVLVVLERKVKINFLISIVGFTLLLILQLLIILKY